MHGAGRDSSTGSFGGQDECSRPTRKTEDKSSDGWQVRMSNDRTRSRAGDGAPLKDVKYEGRSGNVYENKGRDDSLPDTEGDISAQLHAILHRSSRILQKPSPFLPRFDPAFLKSLNDPMARWFDYRFRLDAWESSVLGCLIQAMSVSEFRRARSQGSKAKIL